MIDRKARNAAIGAIRRFRDGQLTNKGFDAEFPSSRTDAAVRAIGHALWFFYDDAMEHRLDGVHALSQVNLRGFNRCVVFLATDTEYIPPAGPVRRFLAALVGQYSGAETSNESPAWPFSSWEACRVALERLGSEGAKEHGVREEYDSAWLESISPEIQDENANVDQ